ncbi:hypothetical protein PPACK8108_LOCUS12684 [Phakopsora pachyrhizi]|uniref:Uncharacterized protein n=1 Tax=Phakopsora pachyrhizi TaxID=170000 RepID=A0AAV0B4I4_PHAPC|nr:hypothetical protein PPACK8108_LOCUS12684 [Phakopsora pachyrhizi]
MKKITRESKLSLQVDSYVSLGTKCSAETGWTTAPNFALPELLNCSKLDAFVTNQTGKVDTGQVGESPDILQIDCTPFSNDLVNLRAGSPYSIFGLISGIPMMIGGRNIDWVVIGMGSTRGSAPTLL